MTLPPDSPITPVTACTIPGRSGQDRVTTSLAFSVMGASLVRFIPFNEAGAGFAGDATGLRGGEVSQRARLRHCGRGSRLSGHDCRFTQVSRAFHEVPRLATPVSRALHAWLACPSPYFCGCAPEPRPNCTDQHEGWHVGPIGGSLNPSMRTLTP